MISWRGRTAQSLEWTTGMGGSQPRRTIQPQLEVKHAHLDHDDYDQIMPAISLSGGALPFFLSRRDHRTQAAGVVVATPGGGRQMPRRSLQAPARLAPSICLLCVVPLLRGLIPCLMPLTFLLAAKSIPYPHPFGTRGRNRTGEVLWTGGAALILTGCCRTAGP